MTVETAMEMSSSARLFGENAESVGRLRGVSNDAVFETGAPDPNANVVGLSQSFNPVAPVASLAMSSAPEPEPANKTAASMQSGQGMRNDKVDAVLGMQVQKANKPGGDMGTSVRTTQELVKQGNMFQEAKASLTGQGPKSEGPKTDILGNKVVEPSLAGRAINFAAGTIGGGLAVTAAAAFVGPKFAATIGAGLAAKDIGGFVGAVSGPRTAEQTIVMDSAYKANPAKGFGEGKRGMGSYNYLAASSSRGPSPEQQAQMASVGGGGSSIRVNPDLAFRASNTGDSLAGINGVRLDKRDPTIMALNQKGQELSTQMETQRIALATPVTRQGWDGVTKAQDAGLNVRPGNTTMEALVPKDQLAQLRKFDAPSLTIG